jgi:uncharacterized membrane protein
MSRDLGQAAFRLGFFIVFVSGLLLFFVERGSAEEAITLITLAIALVFLAVVAILVWLGQRRQ